jgi:hypothetical protein
MRLQLVASALTLLLVACNPPPEPAPHVTGSAPAATRSAPAVAPPAAPPPSVVASGDASVDPERLAKVFDAKLREVLGPAGKPRALAQPARESLDAVCTSHGGVMQMDHISQRLYCTPHMKDEGRPCRTAKDCDGYCRASPAAKPGDRAGGTCSPEKALDGCANVIGADGVVIGQCVN